MPNHPQATSDGSWAPRIPKLTRANTGTGNEMPYFVSTFPLLSMGTSTMRLPSNTVAMACHAAHRPRPLVGHKPTEVVVGEIGVDRSGHGARLIVGAQGTDSVNHGCAKTCTATGKLKHERVAGSIE